MAEQWESTMDRINRLANEKFQLLLKASHQYLSPEDLDRLHFLERELTRLWEIRRQELAGRPDPLDLLIEASYR